MSPGSIPSARALRFLGRAILELTGRPFRIREFLPFPCSSRALLAVPETGQWRRGVTTMQAMLRWLIPFLTGLLLGLFAMLLHEFGHIVAAFAFGVRVKKVGIQWNKGLYTVREQGTVHQNLRIALAGPFTNLILLITTPWFPAFALANFCYALANMLPIDGSDGLRIADCWREIRQERVREVERSETFQTPSRKLSPLISRDL
jgi:hypothetical protein